MKFVGEKLLFVSCSLVLSVISLFSRCLRRPKRLASETRSKIILEAGSGGWDLIEYQELRQCAIEYFGVDSVVCLKIPEGKKYSKVVTSAFQDESVTHYFYDPRTGSQKYSRGLFQATKISAGLIWQGIVPIARVTDVPIRRWRAQARLVTAHSGAVATLMDQKLISGFFPKRRLCGPLIMPFSKQTLYWLKQRRLKLGNSVPRFSVLFAGSIYQPRAGELQELETGLKQIGLHLTRFDRVPGAPRDPVGSYWNRLLYSKFVFSTASQAISKDSDLFSETHLVYRYTEALASGAVLVAPRVAGSEQLIRPMLDYITFDDISEACELISKFNLDSASCERIAESGHLRITELIEKQFFWNTVNRALGADGFVL